MREDLGVSVGVREPSVFGVWSFWGGFLRSRMDAQIQNLPPSPILLDQSEPSVHPFQ